MKVQSIGRKEKKTNNNNKKRGKQGKDKKRTVPVMFVLSRYQWLVYIVFRSDTLLNFHNAGVILIILRHQLLKFHFLQCFVFVIIRTFRSVFCDCFVKNSETLILIFTSGLVWCVCAHVCVCACVRVWTCVLWIFAFRDSTAKTTFPLRW